MVRTIATLLGARRDALELMRNDCREQCVVASERGPWQSEQWEAPEVLGLGTH